MDLFKLIKNNRILYSCLFVILILAGVLFSYQYIFQTWFAMDEWSFWMYFLKYGPFYVIKSTGLIPSLTGGVRFGLDLTNGIYFSLFGLNIIPWQITFLTLHLVNTLLLYKILRTFKILPLSAFIAVFYFAVASAGQEALSWPAAGMQILGSTPFILITILLTLKFIETKRKSLLIIAIFCSYLSFLMRPTGIVTAALIVALIFLFYKRSNLLRLPRIVVILGIAAFILGLIRLLIEYSDKLDLLFKAGFNIIFYPFVSLSHIFIPWRLMFRLSDSLINFYYPTISNDSNVEKISHLIVGDYISSILSIFLLILIYLLYKNVNKFNKKVIVFGLFFFFVQFFVIALYYTDRDWGTYVASRHMYIPSMGISIIFGVLFDFIFTKFKSLKSLKRYIYIGIIILFGVWLYQDMTVTRREVRTQALEDIAIRKTYESLQSLSLPNSNKLVIFLQHERNYYYPDWYLPFKLNASYMMLLAFYGRPFIDKDALGGLHSNNTFINSNNKQFGYFTDIDPLASSIKRGEIKIEDVVGLRFDDDKYTFKITTDETHKLIENELNSNNSDN